jgi:hypothetical protein
MSVGLYMDEHVHSAITSGLSARGVDVLTAQEDGREATEDPDLLDRATALRRVLFSQDDDFLVEGSRRQRESEHFAGIIYAHQLRVSIRQCIDDLELLATASGPADFENRVIHLPFR